MVLGALEEVDDAAALEDVDSGVLDEELEAAAEKVDDVLGAAVEVGAAVDEVGDVQGGYVMLVDEGSDEDSATELLPLLEPPEEAPRRMGCTQEAAWLA